MWKDLSFKERAELINQWHKEHTLDYKSKIREYDKNVANKFDEGGPTYEVSLPEVVVTPTKESKQLRREMQSIINDPILRKQFYNYIFHSDKGMDTSVISDNDKIKRFLELYKKSDSPSIHLNQPGNRPMSTTWIPGINRLDVPVSYYGNEEDEKNIVREMSHAYQFKNDKAKELRLKPNLLKLGLQTIARISDDVNNYHRFGNYEFGAHSVIEPVMHDYISGRINDFEWGLKSLADDVWAHPDAYSIGIDRYAKEKPEDSNYKGLSYYLDN